MDQYSKIEVLHRREGDRMMHLVNGDVVGGKLTDLDGEVFVWREMYDFGPLLCSGSEEELIEARALFFEEKIGIPASLFMENCVKQNQKLREIPKSTDITLWFEHDRYDQTMLMYLLKELSELGFENLSMISIGEYPGMEPFFGLGQLSNQQLTDLFYTDKKVVTKEQIQEAKSGWAAYTSPNPKDLEKFLLDSAEHLPFLKQALQTHFSYFPSKLNGLNEVENLALHFINEQNCSFPKLFQYISEQRPNDGLSDFHFAAMLNPFMEGDYPLLITDGTLPNFKDPKPKATISLTSFGLDVLEGECDRFEYMGIDWWLGGVHLQHDLWRVGQNGLEEV
jgi:hypothetical protein